MAFEIIKSIVEAEKQAESIKIKATADAEEIKANALAKSSEIAADAKLKAKKEGENMIAQAITDSQPQKEEILEDVAKKCEAIKKTAEQRMEKAAEAVIGKVVG